MTLHPIRDEADHAAALTRIAELWNAAPESDEAYELDALATLVDAYEARQFPIAAIEPVEALRLAISEMGHTQAELAEILGSRSRSMEVLSGKRPLTLDLIRAISAVWRMPTDLLVGVGMAPERRVGADGGTRSKGASGMTGDWPKAGGRSAYARPAHGLARRHLDAMSKQSR